MYPSTNIQRGANTPDRTKGALPHENIQKVQWKVKEKTLQGLNRSKKPAVSHHNQKQNSQTLLYKHPDNVQMLLHKFIPRTNENHKNRNGPKKETIALTQYVLFSQENCTPPKRTASSY